MRSWSVLKSVRPSLGVFLLCPRRAVERSRSHSMLLMWLLVREYVRVPCLNGEL